MTGAIANSPEKAPLQIEVDARAETFADLEANLTEAKTRLKDAQSLVSSRENELIELVRRFGGPHYQKSKILHGIVWEMVATFSQYTREDSAAVDRFRQALIEAGQTRLMKKIFTSDTRWTMKSSAAEIVKMGKLSPKLMALLLQCSVTQDKKPSLEVRAKKKSAASV